MASSKPVLAASCLFDEEPDPILVCLKNHKFELVLVVPIQGKIGTLGLIPVQFFKTQKSLHLILFQFQVTWSGTSG
jgi:hypothetical protein